MNPSEIAAWVGAVSGVSALMWDFYKWKTAGPRLVISVSANMLKIPARNKERYVLTRVRNVGSAPTTLTTMVLSVYDSRYARLRMRQSKAMVVVQPSPGQPLPYKLDVGEEWAGMVNQTEELNTLIDTGKLWCDVSHTWSKRPVQGLVSRPQKG